jgi:hypothetical protein
LANSTISKPIQAFFTIRNAFIQQREEVVTNLVLDASILKDDLFMLDFTGGSALK